MKYCYSSMKFNVECLLSFNVLFYLLFFSAQFLGISQNAAFDWAVQIGGNGISYQENCNGLFVDEDRYVYTTGTFIMTADFDPGGGVLSYSSIGDYDAYICKMDENSNLIWAKTFGTTWGDQGQSGYDIAVDDTGNVYSTGHFEFITDFDPGAGIQNLTSSDPLDFYVSKLDNNGDYVWAYQYGSDEINSTDITIDDANNVFITGFFRNTVDFDFGAGVSNLNGTANGHVFVQKLEPDGTLSWVKQFKGVGTSVTRSIDIVDSGAVLISGYYSGMVDVDPGIGIHYITTSPDESGGFICKLDSLGAFLWVKKFTDENQTSVKDVEVDSLGNIYATGYFSGIMDFDPGVDTFNLSATGGQFNPTAMINSFIFKLNSDGDFIWAKSIGGSAIIAEFIALDDQSNVYTTGRFYDSVDFDPGIGEYEIHAITNNVVYNDDRNIFVNKLDSSGEFVFVKQIGGEDDEVGNIVVDNLNNIYIAGEFWDTGDFDPNSGVYTMTSSGSSDILIHKMKGCDNPTDSVSIQHCDSLFYAPDGVQVWQSDGTYSYYKPNSLGDCDSLIVVDLSIGANDDSTLNISTCGPMLSPSGNYIWGTTGIYTDTLVNSSGCDSILEINLSVGFSMGYLSVDSCESFTSPSGAFTWYDSGIYYDTLLNSIGCDSILEINLNIQNSLDSIFIDACVDFQAPNGSLWTNSGIYIDTFENVFGCDSLVYTHLAIHDIAFDTITLLDCDSIVSPSGNFIWYESGIYQDTLSTTMGCDSVITINLTILDALNLSLGSDTILCEGDSFLLNPNLPGVTYLWQDGSIDSVFMVSESGLYWLQVNASGCLDVDSVSIIFNQESTLNLGFDTVLCENEVLILDAYHPNASYSWQDGTTGSAITVSTSGTYWVDVFVPGCGLYTDSIEVGYTEIPELNLGQDLFFCEGDSFLLSPNLSGVSYIWQDGSIDSVFQVSETGIYWVEVAINGCTAIDSVSILYNEEPNLNFGLDTLLCENEVLVLSAYHPNATYLWQDGFVGSGITVTSSGTYWVEVSVPGCGLYTDSIAVEYTAVPQPFLGGDFHLCEGDSYLLSTQLSGVDHIWSNGTSDTILWVSESGDYWVDIIVEGCAKRDSINIQFNSIPNTLLGNDTVLCSGELLSLSAYHPNSSYMWNDGTSVNTKSITESGIYWVDIDVSGCGKFRDSILVEFIEMPTPDLGEDRVLCEGESLFLDVSDQFGAILWQDGSNEDIFVVEEPGTYVVQITNDMCYAEDSIDVSYVSHPNFDFGPSITICEGDSHLFSFSDTSVEYLWQDGSLESELYAFEEGWYSLMQTNDCGSYLDSTYLNVDPCTPVLKMPNVFSPNGDGKNDLYMPINMENISVVSFVIYDRWGITMYSTSEQEILWNGTSTKGENVNNGIYFWILKYSRNGNGTVQKRNGSINVFY